MTQHYQDQLAYYRDLTPDERRAVDAHLGDCAECRALWVEYQQQDAALTAIHEIKPRRVLRRTPTHTGRQWLARVGDGLALAGLGALIWLFALQVQVMAQGGGQFTPAALEPGITLPPTRLAPPSPWMPALPWVGVSLLAVGLLFVFTRKSFWPTTVGAVVAALLLTSFVPPFSLIPNPAGLYWRAVGGYNYDPRLPFRNNFLIAGDAPNTLRPYLDQLLGLKGLTPLDPNSALERYEIVSVSLHPTHNSVTLVNVRFIYEDGTSRVYPVPLMVPVVNVAGFWQAGWLEDGLQRLRSIHLDFPNQPFAQAGDPITLGNVERLGLHPKANRLDEANPSHWLWESVRVERLVAAPDASGFLVAIEVDTARRQLWLVSFNGEPPQAIGAPGDIREYGFSPDSHYIVYTRFDPDAANVTPTRPFAINVAERVTNSRSATVTELVSYFTENLVTGLPTEQLPGLTAEGVWFISDGALWRAPYAGGTPERLLDRVASRFAPRPTPDGKQVALWCGAALCVLEVQNGQALNARELLPRVGEVQMAWSPDDTHLAVIDRDPNNLRGVQLRVVTLDGTQTVNVEIAPRDVTDAPQWTPDGQGIFVQTFPQEGRRIIAVDVPSARVLDLSQPRWDAYFTLLPDGRSLLLNNGRGDFWRVDVNFDR
ncbi:MAG: zf-HC2 domain-containing protein [Anaerolineales bacterium]|nr:zf-HC2 domain-containing protein [Anaerolineales bacterium]